MFRTALRSVLAHKARLLMTVLAVTLGVAFVSGTLVFTSTVTDAYKNSSQKGLGNVDVAIQPHKSDNDRSNPGETPRLTQRLLDQVAAAPGVASVTGSVSGFAAVADKHGGLVSKGGSSGGANYYPGADGKDARYPMKSGQAPARAGDLALDSKTAERAGYRVGDIVRISVDGPVLQQKLTGIFTTDDGNVSAGGSLALFDTATAQKLYAEPGQFDQIDVKAAENTSQNALKADLGRILPEDAEATTGRKLADDQAKDIAESMDGMTTGMLVFAGVALFVSIFIIANTFTMLVAQRTKELALLRAVGATRRQVTRSVLIEALLVGTVAAVAGLLVGIGMGALLRSVMGSSGTEIPDGPLVIPSSAVIASLVVGTVVTMLAAWLPGRRAAKIPPIAAMNSVHAVATARSLAVRNAIGGILAAVGVVTSVLAKDESVMGLGAMLLVIGVFVLTPLLSRPVIAAVAPLLSAFGMPGKLARQNAVRNPRRTAATASALMIGLTLITGLTVIASSVQQAIDKMAADSLKADYVVVMASMHDLSPDIAEKLAATADVTVSSPMRPAPVFIGDKGESLTGVDGATIGRLVKADFTDGSFAGLSGKKVVVDEETAKSHGWKINSSFTVTYEDGRRDSLTVSGVYEGTQMVQGIMVDNATVTPHLTEVNDRQVLVKTASGGSAATEERLRKALGDNPAIQIQSKADISREVAKLIGLMLNILYGLLAMAVIIAVLGVVNTLAMSVSERQREIGMLRAIGLGSSSVQRMVRLESMIISLFGGLLGVALGVFFGWAAGELISTGMPTYELALPWGRLALFLLLAAVVGMLAALWPARRAARMNMLMAIKAD
ncbi:ABC transporter permease [Streptomyces phaeolivaceus]|uniref:ABC transporter permease n=1 Tax=Streptomyces phaeolivaceus TaxID=2653200 RepID=A0A5P8K8N6_9ACTN|nr:ABC transporter permease [Streptomyces phaeolivaceus]QFQ99380.1 ABC transporter permease [Streptomyces phaeolivaceus]